MYFCFVFLLTLNAKPAFLMKPKGDHTACVAIYQTFISDLRQNNRSEKNTVCINF